MSATLTPATFSTSMSVSRNVVPNLLASSRPTVLLPAPGGPTRTTSGAITGASAAGRDVSTASTHDQRVEVTTHVAADLIDRVAAELLENRVRDDESHHR